MEKEVRAIKTDVLKICWHMRGGVTYTEAMNMSTLDRQIVSDIAKDNLETTKKTGLPYF